MRIAVNAWYLRNEELEGIGWFVYQTLIRITKNHSETDFHFLVSKSFPAAAFNFPANVTLWRVLPDRRHPVLYLPYMEAVVPGILKKINPRLFLGPDGVISLRTKYPQLTVIHDINFVHRPQDSKWHNRLYYNFFFPRFAKKAERIATVSEYSKQDIAQTFRVPPEKIDVVYNGIHDFFKPLSEEEKKTVRQKYTAGDAYLVFIGSINPRKNIDGLIKAFDRFKQETGSSWKLLLVGKKGWKEEAVETAYRASPFKNDIIFTGRVSGTLLNGLLAAAAVSVFVPHFEGFGMPAIEAMQCEVPLICSNTTCLPEIAGDAALIVDPSDTEQIAAAMVRLFSGPALARHLVEKGKVQKQKFSWEKSADLLWESIIKAIK